MTGSVDEQLPVPLRGIARQAGEWRTCAYAEAQVANDRSRHLGIHDDRNGPHGVAAPRACENVQPVHALEKLSPGQPALTLNIVGAGKIISDMGCLALGFEITTGRP